MRGIRQKDFRQITRALSVQKKVSENTVLCIKHNFQLKLVSSIHSVALLSQGTVLQLTTDHQMICAQVHTQCHKSYVGVIRQVRVICTSEGMQKSLGCALYVRCALYLRCALSVLEKECRKVWGARYTLGARYRSENTVYSIVLMVLLRY